jgi:hypothetical protein
MLPKIAEFKVYEFEMLDKTFKTEKERYYGCLFKELELKKVFLVFLNYYCEVLKTPVADIKLFSKNSSVYVDVYIILFIVANAFNKGIEYKNKLTKNLF